MVATYFGVAVRFVESCLASASGWHVGFRGCNAASKAHFTRHYNSVAAPILEVSVVLRRKISKYPKKHEYGVRKTAPTGQQNKRQSFANLSGQSLPQIHDEVAADPGTYQQMQKVTTTSVRQGFRSKSCRERFPDVILTP